MKMPTSGSLNRPNTNLVMVAVGKDKNSGHAFRWTTNNIDNPIIIAVHVKHKDIPHQGQDREGANVFPPDEDDVANVFEPLREMCNDKVVKMKEAVINDSDIARGISEYAKRNHVQHIIVGAPSSYTKNVLSRSLNMRTISKKFKGHDDVPTAIMKSAPDYSSVYVIAKEKIVETRPATAQLENAVSTNDLRSSTFKRGGSTNSSRSGKSPGLSPLHDKLKSSSSTHKSLESIDLSNRGHRSSFNHTSSLNENESSRLHKYGLDAPKLERGSSMASDSQVLGDMAAEMKELRLQLRQTMEMYNSACKEAILAKNKAKEINKWKLEERTVEEVMMSREAALAMAEIEKAKAVAALKSVDEAMKMAEKETQKRLHAERKARREIEERDQALNVIARTDIRYRQYTLEEIENATKNFSLSMKIGEGGYGPVFKGQLDHTHVAIKILRPDAHQGRKQFLQEVEVLCNIRHPNMVLLLGACQDYGCLVYEYMDNGSLEDRLFRKHNSPPIPWQKRLEICYEIATALLFLHQTKPESIVHRDLKPANILLDKNFVSKISDVGLSRLVPPSVADSVTQYHMTSAAGTLCYIDPEYQQTGKLTAKSDIYSLGIMFLQIITARPPMGLSHQVKKAIENGNFVDMLDPVVMDWPTDEALAFAKLALSCAELSKKDRPDLALEVIPELSRLRDLGCKLQNCQQNWSHAPRPPTPPRPRSPPL
ncbi:U-box domain-containing protein 35-like isoform X2 [Vicia villosa]|uniref:U-box domain-containing protein 35-like isoform X2 n=1 Tax=Vicia villosa TaxID=3911 RepID=UPI00273B314A|nr:U-box domain-containing protein 35-like isoform X2 [Vicia villosa]XP_058757610.1 U-box domain-containing protein 35-like isoform X2 [Vicia villosa]